MRITFKWGIENVLYFPIPQHHLLNNKYNNIVLQINWRLMNVCLEWIATTIFFFCLNKNRVLKICFEFTTEPFFRNRLKCIPFCNYPKNCMVNFQLREYITLLQVNVLKFITVAIIIYHNHVLIKILCETSSYSLTTECIHGM